MDAQSVDCSRYHFAVELVPVNFRLKADEIAYIVRHSGALAVLVDPELDEALPDVEVEHRFVLGEKTASSSSGGVARRHGSESPTRTPRSPSTTPNVALCTRKRHRVPELEV